MLPKQSHLSAIREKTDIFQTKKKPRRVCHKYTITKEKSNEVLPENRQ
jgi:hypothetical protein